jgi:hypothetical protein
MPLRVAVRLLLRVAVRVPLRVAVRRPPNIGLPPGQLVNASLFERGAGEEG